jgi:hypothetical protein
MPDDRPADEQYALNALQGAVNTPVIDSEIFATTTHLLREIRDSYSEVRNIRTGPDETFLLLIVNEQMSAGMTAALHQPLQPEVVIHVPQTGFQPLDSVNGIYRVRRIDLRYSNGRYFIYEWFAPPVNVPVLAQAYRRIPGILRAGSDSYVTTDDEYDRVTVIRKPPFYHVVFAWHRGGMTRWSRYTTYYFTYDTRVGSLVEYGDGTRFLTTSGIPLWQRSGPASLRPYATYADLIQATADTAWWVRRAAIEVLGFLFEHPHNPWGRDVWTDSVRDDAIKDGVWSHARDVIALLERATQDPDDDVRAAATGALAKARAAGAVP